MNDPLITAITEHVFLIKAPNRARFPHCNSILFKGDQTLLIDAGLGDALMEEVDALFSIDTLLISHTHPDHILSWSKFRDKTLMLPKETPDSAFDLETLAHRYTGSAEIGRHWIDGVGKPLKIKALREKVMALPYKRVISSHSNPVEGDAAIQFNAFINGLNRQKTIVFNALGSGKTLAELVEMSPMYRNKFMDRVIQNLFEKKMITECLNMLLSEERIVEEGSTFIPKDVS